MSQSILVKSLAIFLKVAIRHIGHLRDMIKGSPNNWNHDLQHLDFYKLFSIPFIDVFEIMRHILLILNELSLLRAHLSANSGVLGVPSVTTVLSVRFRKITLSFS